MKYTSSSTNKEKKTKTKNQLFKEIFKEWTFLYTNPTWFMMQLQELRQDSVYFPDESR